ncbi:Nipped-B-like protein [Actinidia chinensis var. chinensis]|uniref:Nipped-B-like protein n=1 Tax=Actinidia chinensis var. chinensis TaxID=1590841 RepID=A0A2R6RYV7_ACTCC|nr:Nipped-B-like protein [Actinidia chinensis var. chinensis]
MEEEEELQKQDNESLSLCLSFNTYTTGKFAEIAAKVTQETSTDDDENGDFEFSLVRSDTDVTTDEIFRDGQIRQIFPIFNRDLENHDDNKSDLSNLRVSLKKLFIDDREEQDPPSSSSEEAEELESVPEGLYCVWRPKLAESPSPSRCEKSNSTGSASKQWRIRDLLRRSNSEGKDSFVFLTPKKREEKAEKMARAESPKLKAEKVKASSAHEMFYVRNRVAKEENKRKSYLPYRQNLVGFFASVNGFGRTFPPF